MQEGASDSRPKRSKFRGRLYRTNDRFDQEFGDKGKNPDECRHWREVDRETRGARRFAIQGEYVRRGCHHRCEGGGFVARWKPRKSEPSSSNLVGSRWLGIFCEELFRIPLGRGSTESTRKGLLTESALSLSFPLPFNEF